MTGNVDTTRQWRSLSMRHTWRGFLKAQQSPEARILLTTGGDEPGRTKARLATLHKYGDLDGESFKHRMEIFNELFDAYMNRENIDMRDPGDWVPLNDDGARMRRVHLNSEGSTGYD